MNPNGGPLAVVQSKKWIKVYKGKRGRNLQDKFPRPDWCLQDVLHIYSSTGTHSPVYAITVYGA